MPTTKAIQAIWVAAPAIPVKPSTPAIIAMIRNVTAQLIMCFLLIFNIYPNKQSNKNIRMFVAMTLHPTPIRLLGITSKIN